MSSLTPELTTVSKPDDRDIAMILEMPPAYRHVLEVIAQRYMRDGYSYARQDQIAKTAGTSKSTVQRAVQYCDDRGILWVYARDPETYDKEIIVRGRAFGPGRSNIMFPAPGLKQAIREAKKPDFSRFGSKVTPIPSSPRESISSEEQIATPRARVSVPARSTNACLPQEENVEKRPAIEQEIAQSAKPFEAKDFPTLSNLVDRMVAEGMAPGPARNVAKIVPPAQIARNIDLGRHRGKNNPGGYLYALIRADAASAQPLPGSEFEAVRKAEDEKKRPVAQKQDGKATARALAPTPEPPVERMDPAKLTELIARTKAALALRDVFCDRPMR